MTSSVREKHETWNEKEKNVKEEEGRGKGTEVKRMQYSLRIEKGLKYRGKGAEVKRMQYSIRIEKGLKYRQGVA
jgi:hypothetical protein